MGSHMSETTQPDDLLTLGDVAKAAGVSPSAVTQWQAKGALPVWKRTVGGMRLFLRRDVDACLASREVDRAQREAGR